jgi:amidohydrolase
MENTFLRSAETLAPKLIEIRRALHRHPELSFEEHQTAELVAQILRSLGIDVETGVGKTGVVGHLGQEGPVVALRADMDALPIQELNEVDYASQVPGVMHACGHDVHTACLLGAAMLLRGVDLPGQVWLLFQPSEEGMDDEGKSGARRMVEEGAFDGVSAVFGLHVHGSYPAGTVICSSGSMAAAMDSFRAVIRGSAAHAAYAWEGVDAILLASQVVTNLHTIVSRRISPIDSGVISVGVIQGGSKENNLADQVELRGTIRSLHPAVRQVLFRELDRACQVAKALGGDYELRIQEGYPPVINDEELAALVRRVASNMVGPEAVHERPPELGSEDFSFFMQRAPGCYFELGVRVPGQPLRPMHSPHFDVDESMLPLGAAILAGVARAYLEEA